MTGQEKICEDNSQTATKSGWKIVVNGMKVRLDVGIISKKRFGTIWDTVME